MCQFSSSHLPIVLAKPDAKMKLVVKKAPIISVVFLPSKKPNTSPNTIPNGKPFINKQMILNGGGITAKASNESHAIPINKIM